MSRRASTGDGRCARVAAGTARASTGHGSDVIALTTADVVSGVTVVNAVLMGGVLAISFTKRAIAKLFDVSAARGVG